MGAPEQGIYVGQVQFLSLHIYFDSGDLLTGVPIHDAAAGDILLPLGWVSFVTTWDGATPFLSIFPEGEDPSIGIDKMSAGTSLDDVSGSLRSFGRGPVPASAMQLIAPKTIIVTVDDGAGGDPGSTQGEAFVTLAVSRFSNRPTS